MDDGQSTISLESEHESQRCASEPNVDWIFLTSFDSKPKNLFGQPQIRHSLLAKSNSAHPSSICNSPMVGPEMSPCVGSGFLSSPVLPSSSNARVDLVLPFDPSCSKTF
jgi:hypothetical protein